MAPTCATQVRRKSLMSQGRRPVSGPVRIIWLGLLACVVVVGSVKQAEASCGDWLDHSVASPRGNPLGERAFDYLTQAQANRPVSLEFRFQLPREAPCHGPGCRSNPPERAGMPAGSRLHERLERHGCDLARLTAGDSSGWERCAPRYAFVLCPGQPAEVDRPPEPLGI